MKGRQHLQEMTLVKLNVHTQKNDMYIFHSTQKIKYKWVRDGNMKLKVLKLLEKKTTGSASSSVVNDFMNKDFIQTELKASNGKR